MMKFLIALFVLLAIPVILFLSETIYVVKTTEYAVVTQFGGEVIAVYKDPGLKWKIPMYHKVFRYPARARSIDAPPEHIVTGDQKKLIVDHYIKWKIIDPVQFRNRIAKGDDSARFIRRAEDRISIIGHNALKDVLGNHELSEVISGSRDSITMQAMAIAQAEATELGIHLTDIRIKRVELPKANVEKAFNRMKAQRLKEASYYRSRGEEQALSIRAETDKEVTTLLAEADMEAKKIRAKADGEVAAMYAKSYNRDPDFYSFYRSLQALKETMDTSTVLVISPESELFRYLQNP